MMETPKNFKAIALEGLIKTYDKFAAIANDESQTAAMRDIAAKQCELIAHNVQQVGIELGVIDKR